jgi:hypothetical protein
LPCANNNSLDQKPREEENKAENFADNKLPLRPTRSAKKALINQNRGSSAKLRQTKPHNLRKALTKNLAK